MGNGTKKWWAALAATVVTLAGCGGGGGGENAKRGTAAVATWNDIATQAVAKSNEASGPPGLPPFAESRLYAMAFIAVHDALNAIERRYQPYASDLSAPEANPEAAVAAAVRNVYAMQLPGTLGFVDAAYAAELGKIPDGASKSAGVALGQRTADAINTLRAADGSATANGPYVPGSAPGNYRFTPPFDGPPFNGFVDAPLWGKVRPFAMTSGQQFRAMPPYSVSDVPDPYDFDYTSDYEDVRKLGAATGSTRMPEQTEIGLFWLESSALGWNRIAMNVSRLRSVEGWDLARLQALVQIAIADSYIASFDSKYTYNFWRPITAIHMADLDRNPGTTADPSWTPLGVVTPPVPEYPSAHASAGGAAQAVLANEFSPGEVKYATTSTSLPGVTRSYDNFRMAAQENARSRVYVGYHFAMATEVGLQQGFSVGSWAVRQKLQPVK